MIDVIMNWQASTLHAWGILGLNIFMHLAEDPEVRPVMGHMMQDSYFPMLDPIRTGRFLKAANASNQYLQHLLSGNEYQRRNLQAVLMNSLGNTMLSSNDRFSSRCEVGRLVFEDSSLPDAKNRLARYQRVLCCSSWNAEIVGSKVSTPTSLILEGIDPSLFHPAPRSGFMDPDKFYVFSGGKLEFRKGQDIVVKAFRDFAARHSDAVLVTAWRSPWAQQSAGLKGILGVPLALTADGQIAITKWCADNGIPPAQVIDVGLISNLMMPTVVREMDCAIAISRCEGGTSLPAMECMACGVPVIVANNTGLRDLIDDGNCLPVMRQTAVASSPDGACTDGWGESSVEEVVECLERLYADTQMRRAIGSRAAQWILEQERTWSAYTRKFKDLVKIVSR